MPHFRALFFIVIVSRRAVGVDCLQRICMKGRGFLLAALNPTTGNCLYPASQLCRRCPIHHHDGASRLVPYQVANAKQHCCAVYNVKTVTGCVIRIYQPFAPRNAQLLMMRPEVRCGSFATGSRRRPIKLFPVSPNCYRFLRCNQKS